MSKTMNEQVNETVTIAEFEEMLAAYGAKPAHWPPAHNEAMEKCAASQAEAAALMARAARLDDFLDAQSHAPSDALQSRILRDMERAMDAEIIALSPPVHLSSRAFLAGATAMAACFIGGIIMAPLLVDSLIGNADLLASLDIFSDAFLPTEPL
jgi:hypothetical protein